MILAALVLLTPLIASAQPVNPLDITIKAGEALRSKDYAGALEAYRQLMAMAERMVEWLESKVPSPRPTGPKTARAGDFEVAVLEVKYPRYVIFENPFMEGYGRACAPKYRSARLVAVKLRIRNLGDEEVSAGLLSLRLVTASGRKYKAKSIADLERLKYGSLSGLKALYPGSLVVGAEEDYFSASSIPPGASWECWAVFQVPVSEEPVGLEASTWKGSAFIRLGRGR